MLCLGSACGYWCGVVGSEVGCWVGWALPAWAPVAVCGCVSLDCCRAAALVGAGVGASSAFGGCATGLYRGSACGAAGAGFGGECVAGGMEGGAEAWSGGHELTSDVCRTGAGLGPLLAASSILIGAQASDVSACRRRHPDMTRAQAV